MTAGVYLAHFDTRYRHAGHYIGWAEDIEARAAKHARGNGGRLMAVIKAAGIGFVIARTWPGESRTFERRLKNRKNAPRECPICQGRPWPEVTAAAPVAEDLAEADPRGLPF